MDLHNVLSNGNRSHVGRKWEKMERWKKGIHLKILLSKNTQKRDFYSKRWDIIIISVCSVVFFFSTSWVDNFINLLLTCLFPDGGGELVAQLCPTLCHFSDYSPPGFSVHGILQARILTWVPIPFSWGFSWPRDRTTPPALQGNYYWLSHQRNLISW